MTRPRPLAPLSALVAVLALTAAACGGGGGDDDAEQTLTELYAPGVCFDFTESGGLAQDEEQLVDCTTPHDAEIVAHLTVPAEEGAPFPGNDELRAFAAPECDAALVEYTGLALLQLDLGTILLFPTEPTWAEGDRTVLCAASREEPPLLQSSIAAGADGAVSAPTTPVELPEPGEGECFLFTTPDVIAGATVVDCAQPHDGEVYALIGAGAADAPFPGDETLSTLAGTECGARLGDFLGGGVPDPIRATAFQPAETAWANGDRDIECVIVPTGDGTISGTAAGQGT